jgi:hypothetical protein
MKLEFCHSFAGLLRLFQILEIRGRLIELFLEIRELDDAVA